MDINKDKEIKESGECPSDQVNILQDDQVEQNGYQENQINQRVENNEELINNNHTNQLHFNQEDIDIQNKMINNEESKEQFTNNMDLVQSERQESCNDNRDLNQEVYNQQQNNNQENEENTQNDEQNEVDQNNINQNPAQIYTSMINSMNNEPFLHEETLVGIYELLHLNNTEIFDEIDRSQSNWKSQIEAILKKKLEYYNKKGEIISNIYQQNIPNKSMHNIEKIMSIIKSKEKEIYIYKIEKPMTCCHHKNNHNSNSNQLQQDVQNTHQNIQETENQDNNLYNEVSMNRQNQSPIPQQVMQMEENEKSQLNLSRKCQNEIENNNQTEQISSQGYHQNDAIQDEDKQLFQDEGKEIAEIDLQQENNDDDQNEEVSDENLERLQQKLDETEEIRLKQEEQKRNLIEENQRLKNEYEQIVLRNQKLKREYEEQVKVENYLLRKEAVAQLQRLAEQSQQQENHQIQNNSEQSTTENQTFQDQNQSQLTEENQKNLNLLDQSNDQEISIKYNQDRINFENQYMNQQQGNIYPGLNQNEENNLQHQREANLERINEEQQHHHHNNGEQCDQQHPSSQMFGQNFSINDIQSIMQMQFVDLQRLKKLNPIENSITFEMNDNYLIKIRSCEQVKYDQSSICSKIPHFIFKDHIFPFLSSVELFRVRSVTPEWREMVREVWHKTFKRDMQEQILATDLCKEIESQFKLMHIRNPFFQKLNILIRAMVEVINWSEFEKKCLEGQLNAAEKKVIVALLRILGYNLFDYEHINQFEESEFQKNHVDIAMHMKNYLDKSINNSELTSQELKYVYENFLSQADISISMFRNDTDKNQYFIYSLLRNYITSSSVYMQYAKNKLDALSRDWPSSKGFLEGAYRILLLRNVSIKNGQIVNNDSDDGNESQRLLTKTKKSQRMKVDRKQNKNKQLQKFNGQLKENNEMDIQKIEYNSKQQQQSQQSSDLSQQVEIKGSEQQTQETNQDIVQNNQISSENLNHNSNNLIHSEQNNQNENTEGQNQEEKERVQNEKQGQDDNNNNEKDEVDEEEDSSDDEEKSQTELSQLMRSIFNLQKQDTSEPDIVIKRKSGIMKIFLDQGTKLDIILSTVLSVGMQRAQREDKQEAVEQLESSKQTLDKLEQQFSDNQNQIDEMKKKSKDLEECILQKQSELEQVIQRNQKLNEEFQQNIQEINYIQNNIQQYEEEIGQFENENQNNNNNNDNDNQDQDQDQNNQ